MRKLSEEEIQFRKAKAEYTRKWRKEHPEYQRKWREANKKHISDYNKNYNTTIYGRASYLLQGYNRQDMMHGRGKGDLTAQWIVDNIFSKACVHCGKTGWKVIGCNRLDNTKPHTMDNVEPCCEECNKKLGGIYNKMRYSRKIYQYTIDGELVKVWESACEAGRNGFEKGAVSACCLGKYGYKTHKGYRWSYTPL